MKIKFIVPKEASNESIFDPSPAKAGGIHFLNFSIAYLAALTPPDADVELIDNEMEEIDYDDKVDLVGITVWTKTANVAYSIADEFRKRGTPVVLGGNHPSLNPNDAITHANVVVIGEGEDVWPSLVNNHQYLEDGKIISSGKRHNLNNLPIPKFNLYKNIDQYIPLFGLFATRGCPFKCYFCADSKFNGGVQRKRPVEEIVDWILHYKKEFLPIANSFNIDSPGLTFTDTNLWVNPKYTRDLFKALIPLDIKWTSQGSVTAVKQKDVIELAALAGCKEMAVGFETIDPVTLKKDINKLQNKIEDYEHFITLMKENKIALRGTFMFGSDNDDLDAFEKTADFIEDNQIDVPILSINTPFPGTQLYENLEKKNRIFERDWAYYNCSNLVFFPKIEKRIFKRYFMELQTRIFSKESIEKRLKNTAFPVVWAINECISSYVNSFDKEQWINA